MIPQLKSKLEEERLFQLNEGPCGLARSVAFDVAVSILMPVIEKLVKDRDSYVKYCEHMLTRRDKESEINYLNQEILKLLEGGE